MSLWRPPVTVVGIVWPTAAGKSSLAKIISERYGLRVRELSDEIKAMAAEKRYPIVSREAYSLFAEHIRKSHGPGHFVERILASANGSVIVSGIRNPITTFSLHAKTRLYLLGIDAEPKIRYRRLISRRRPEDAGLSFDDFMRLQDRERPDLETCSELVNGHFVNNGSEWELRRDVEFFLACEPPFSSDR